MSDTSRPSRVVLCARIAEHGLIAAECDALFGGVPDGDGVARAERVGSIERAAFAQTALTVLAEGTSLHELIDVVRRTVVDAERFRVDVHDPSGRLGIDSSEVARRLADVIDFGPDLDDPVNRFVVVATSGAVRFGSVTGVTGAGHRVHESKPWTTSSSLDPRFSRGLLNLVPGARSILDPCCGAGSIVLEAASLGLGARGVDWKNAMAGMTRENLAHFGYDARPDVGVDRADAREIDVTADAIVTDLPYGHAIERDDENVLGILRRCASLAPTGVFVAHRDISELLDAAGHHVTAVHTVVKRRGFTRHVHVTESRSTRRF